MQQIPMLEKDPIPPNSNGSAPVAGPGADDTMAPHGPEFPQDESPRAAAARLLGKRTPVNALSEDLAAQLGPRLFRYFYATFSSSLASDLVQEVFLRLIPRLGEVDEARGNTITYAYGIAHNVRKEALRQRVKDRRVDPLGPANEPVYDDPVFEHMEERDATVRLREAIATLKEDERAVMLLLVEGDLPLAEIGQILDMPVGTVKSHVHRAKIHLKALLDPIRPAEVPS